MKGVGSSCNKSHNGAIQASDTLVRPARACVSKVFAELGLMPMRKAVSRKDSDEFSSIESKRIAQGEFVFS